MSQETALMIAGYGKFFNSVIFIIFYGMLFHILKTKKPGERDFGKYSNLGLMTLLIHSS